MTVGIELQVGSVRIRSLVERLTTMPVGMIPSATVEALDQYGGLLRPWAWDGGDELLFAIQAICLEADGRKIMVDTCIGPRVFPDAYGDIANDGSFIVDLTAAGFGRDDVDLVVCTHLHFDHVGWNTILEDGKWVPTFRRARYIVGAVEYDHWLNTTEEQKAAKAVYNFDDAVTPLFDAGLVDLVPADHELSETIRFLPTPGHTPGHFSVCINSRGESAIISGDCSHHPVQYLEPGWSTDFDWDPEMAAATRKAFVQRCADQAVTVLGTHFRPPTAGRFVTADGGRIEFRVLSGGELRLFG